MTEETPPLLAIDIDPAVYPDATSWIGVCLDGPGPSPSDEGFYTVLELFGKGMREADAHFLARADGAWVIAPEGGPYALRIEMDEGTKVVCTGRLKLSIANRAGVREEHDEL